VTHTIVFTTFGSLGDLFPFLAVGSALQARGHRALIATSEAYRPTVEARGLAFRPVRPDLAPLASLPKVQEWLWDPRHGAEFLVRALMLPHLQASYEDLRAACAGAALLVAHPLAYAAPLVAETLGLPWLSVALQPFGFFSTYDPPVLAAMPMLRHLRRLGRRPHQLLFGLASRQTWAWAQPIQTLRKRLGLSPVRQNPLMAGAFSPYGTTAWFSRGFAAPQPDWPPQTTLTGFPFLREDAPLEPELACFLQAGEPPIVFTLGSAAVMRAGNFYQEALAAAKRLGRRAVLLVGTDPHNRPGSALPATVHVMEYAPYSALFARAACVVHHGGIGTSAQALRASRPMLVVPWAYDQPDNAERLRRLGVCRTLSRRHCQAERLCAELKVLLTRPEYPQRAQALAEQVRREDGAAAAAECILRAAG
jgi:rhamnosyltransferase subunit B